MITELLIVTVVTVILFFHSLNDLFRIHLYKFPNGPWSLPIIGGLHHLGLHRPHLAIQKLVKKYGRIFSIRMGPVGRVVIISDFELINQVLDSPLTNDRPSFKFLQIISPDAHGIGSLPYGSKWMKITRLFHRGFSRFSHTSMSEQCSHCYGKLVERFQEHAGCPYNPKPDVVKTVSMVLSSVVYGEKYESLDAENLAVRRHYHTFILSCLNPAHPINLFPWLWHIPSPWKTKVLKMMEYRDKVFEDSLKTHCEQYEEIRDIMDLVAYFKQEDDKGDVTLKDLFISIWVFYMAGSDLYVDALNWMMIHLCANQDIQRKLQAELDRVLPEKREPTMADKDDLNYTRAVVFETLRMASPAALGVPHLTASDVTVEGYNIPKGTTIMFDIWGVHHNQKYWEDPFKFKPERFLDENGIVLDHQHIRKLPLLPFSRGKRPCLGRFIAPDLFMLFAAKTFRNFSMTFPAGVEPDMRGQFIFNLAPCEFQTIMTPRT